MPKAYGKMGCNRYDVSSQYGLVRTKFDFGHIAVSMMLCEDMKLEDAFCATSVWNYRFDGNDLIWNKRHQHPFAP